MTPNNKTEWREFWLDELSEDANGWMDAIPVLNSDDEKYPRQFKVIDIKAYEASQARVKKLEKIIEILKEQRNDLIEPDWPECIGDRMEKIEELNRALGDEND